MFRWGYKPTSICLGAPSCVDPYISSALTPLILGGKQTTINSVGLKS